VSRTAQPPADQLSRRRDPAFRAYTAPPLVRASAEQFGELSLGELKLWCFETSLPPGVSYQPPVTVRLAGPLHPHALRTGLGALWDRHESLRTHFPLPAGRPARVVDPPGPRPIPLIDLSGLPPDRQWAQAQRLVYAEADRPYDYAAGPTARMTVLRLGPGEHVLVLGVHHLLFDLWSQLVLAEELSALYPAYRDGRPSPLPPPRFQYSDYAQWQRTWLSGERLAGQLDYWRDRVRGLPELALPLDFPRPHPPNLFREKLWWSTEPVLAERLRALGRAAGATLFSTMLAAFQVLLGRSSDSTDVAVVTPTPGRVLPELERITGFMVRDYWLRADVSATTTFRELLDRTYQQVLVTHDHQDIPYEPLAVELDPGRDLRPHPMLQIHFSVHSFPTVRAGLPEVGMTGLDFRGQDKYLSPTDLEMQVYDGGSGGLAWTLVYDPALFSPVTVSRLGERFATLLAAVVADPDIPVGALPLLPDTERSLLLDAWQGDPAVARAAAVSRLVRLARQCPDRIALVDANGGQLSYRALVARIAPRRTGQPVPAKIGPAGEQPESHPLAGTVDIPPYVQDSCRAGPVVFAGRVDGPPPIPATVRRWLSAGAIPVAVTGCDALPAGCLYEPVAGPDSTPRGALVLGRPLPGVRAYVVDDRGALLPAGRSGRLLIGGDGLVPGYDGRPGSTAARFAPDRYGPPGSRVFDTGVTARHRLDGRLERAGDTAWAVEVGGYRVDLGSVEAVLAGHPAVVAAAVTVRVHDTGVRTRRLVGYVRPATPPGPGAEELRRYLASRLPEHEIPAELVALPVLPLTADGRADRAALPELAAATPLPRTPLSGRTEHAIAHAWAAVLGVEPHHAEDNFFLLGGDSLAAAEAAYRISAALGIAYPLAALWHYPTLGRSAEVVAALLAANRPGSIRPSVQV